MDMQARQLLHGLIFIMGLVLIVGGIAAGKPGALIGGLIVAAVNFQWWQRCRSGQGDDRASG